MIQFISDTPKQRVYSYPSKVEEAKFRLFWQMGKVEIDPQTSITDYLKKFKTK